MSRLLRITFVLLIACVSIPLDAAERVALVIGNGDYAHGSVLRNPPADARDVANVLSECGFTLVGDGPLEDLSHEGMAGALAEFASLAADAKVSLFFFAGHGLEMGGTNFLVPVDAQVEAEYQVRHRTVALDEVLGAMAEGGPEQLKVVILDCCRNNPLGRSWSRSSSQGLAAPKSTPGGTILVFAAAPGQVASDGQRDNSPFTAALEKELLQPGLEIETVFKRIGASVKSSTGIQEPWMNSSFYGSFSFVPGDPNAKPMQTNASATGEGTQAGEVREFGGVEMVWCPPGEYLRGSPPTELDREAYEEQQHLVQLTKGFWIARTECTQAQWDQVMPDNPSGLKTNHKLFMELYDLDPREMDRLPIYNVQWNEAKAWVDAMNESSPLPAGWKWSLPTDAQWEYACRAGTKTAYSFGDDPSLLHRYGNFADKNADVAWKDETQDDSVGQIPSRVGRYAPNPWGIFDMHGNVWEWCGDGYQAPIAETQEIPTIVDPVGSSSSPERPYRGGSYADQAKFCRSAKRLYSSPDVRWGPVGFRVVVVAE